MSKSQLDQKILEARRLIGLNQDSRQYFYEKADEKSVDWLWKNGFFHVLREKAEVSERYSYRTPELTYLVRVAKLEPGKVVKIILDTPITFENFNPEVVDQFSHICSDLPGKELSKLVKKIHNEQWPVLMSKFNQFGFDYQKMFSTLEKSGDSKELLVLAEAVFALCKKEGIDRERDYYDNPFCLKNLAYTKVFQAVANIPRDHLEIAFALCISVITEITLSGRNRIEADSIFHIADPYPLYDVDIFKLSLHVDARSTRYDEDVRELVAATKVLANRLVDETCKDKDLVNDIYSKYISTLPDSQLMWRLRLYFVTLCPTKLEEPLRETLFRLFVVEKYTQLLYGAEYKSAIKKTFPFLVESDQRKYIESIRKLFLQTELAEEVGTRLRDGSRILSMIKGHLSDSEKQRLVNDGFDLGLDYDPSPMIGQVISGFVQAKGPISAEELHQLSVTTVAQNLRETWAPENLKQLDTERNFLKPLNAEGMGELIREDVQLRVGEYLSSAMAFFDRASLDLHYTYSFLNGVEKAIEKSVPISQQGWNELLDFCLKIKESFEMHPVIGPNRDDQVTDTWLGRSNAVHRGIVDVLIKAVDEKGRVAGFNLNLQRNKVYEIIRYLFMYPDPIPEDEKLKSAKMTVSTANEAPAVSDPFTLAINSIRGRAFELFVSIVNGETSKNSEAKIQPDLKLIYEGLLRNENTRAIMFLFGHYLPTFFFKDKGWLRNLLPIIFPSDKSKYFLYLAAWEGYLANNLYTEIFTDTEFQGLYERAIDIVNPNFPNQKHFLDPDEGLAQHFALAYMHSEFGFGDVLFDKFWATKNVKRHTAFISRLGRFYISGENPKADKLIRENAIAREKLKKMWDWVLSHYEEPSIFFEFGFWINLNKGIFTPNELAERLVRTLQRTGGYLEWDVNLVETIADLALNSPLEAMEIARLFLLEGGVRKGKNTIHFTLDEHWKAAIGELFQNPLTRPQTATLINDLIREGGRLFWPLKDIMTASYSQ